MAFLYAFRHLFRTVFSINGFGFTGIAANAYVQSYYVRVLAWMNNE